MIILLKIGISALLIVVLLSRVDMSDMLAHVQTMDPWWLLSAIAVYLLVFPVMADRLRRLAALKHPIGFMPSLVITWVGGFFGQVLPSTVGGDPFRVFLFKREGASLMESVRVILADRISGIMAILLIVYAGLPWFFMQVDGLEPRLVVLFTLLAVTAGFLVVMGMSWLPQSWLRFAILAHLASSAVFLRHALLTREAGLGVFLGSLAVQVLHGCTAWLIAKSIGVPASLLALLFFMPLMNVAAMLPISVAGWGVRDVLLVIGLSLLGVANDAALTLSISFGVIGLIGSLPGFMLWLLQRR